MLVFRLGHAKIPCWIFIPAHPQGKQKHSLSFPSITPPWLLRIKDNKVCLFLKVINGWWLALMGDTRRGKTPLDMIDHHTYQCRDRFAD